MCLFRGRQDRVVIDSVESNAATPRTSFCHGHALWQLQIHCTSRHYIRSQKKEMNMFAVQEAARASDKHHHLMRPRFPWKPGQALLYFKDSCLCGLGGGTTGIQPFSIRLVKLDTDSCSIRLTCTSGKDEGPHPLTVTSEDGWLEV